MTEVLMAGFEAALSYVGPLLLLVVGTLFFLMLPVSSVLRVVTRPLGYDYSSCPHCPDFGFKRLEYAECVTCGRCHARGFAAAAAYRDGEGYEFCSNECLRRWGGRDDA